mgnify:CR=1 FL=1
MIELQHVSAGYGAQDVVRDVSFAAPNGQLTALIGPNGSGKTTLIRTINALESLDGGEIILYGEDYLKGGAIVDKRQMRAGVRRIGMVFQSFNLFPHRTVLDNVMLAPRYHHLASDAELRQHACELLLNTNKSITTIAFECGFNDSNYFGDAFRRTKGVSPNKYRRNQERI